MVSPATPPAVPSISAKEFLLTIWGDEKGVSELTIIGSKLQKGGFKVAYPFVYPDSIDSFLGAAANHNRADNVYMGVCLRGETWPRKTGRFDAKGEEIIQKRGTEDIALSSMVIWAEFDFAEHGHKGKTVPEAQARKALQEFPRKPSIIVRSGGGIQVYWLTKELVTGSDLWHLKAINRAIAKHLNADGQSVDLARVLRIPWTKNYNYDPVRTVEISWWHPENRYLLDDFDFLPIEEELRNMGLQPGIQAAPPSAAPAAAATTGSSAPGAQPPAPAPAPAPEIPQTPSEAFKAAAASPEGIPDHIPTPTIELKEETIAELGKLVAQLWSEGDRHELALCISGWFAKTGVKESSTQKVIEIASQLNGGDTPKRLKDLQDTYRNLNLKPIKGKMILDKIVEQKPEGKIRSAYQFLLKSINARLPKTKGHKREMQEMDFKILHLTKYTSSPARWTVVVEKDLNPYTTILDNSPFWKYEQFVEEVGNQNPIALVAGLKNPEWRSKIHEAMDNGLYEEKEAPTDSRPSGAIEQGLHEFIGDARENPDIGLLKKFAGHDEEVSFFVLNTFKGYLDEQGHKFTQHQITEKLRDMGWDHKVRRFGKKTPHVWFKSILAGGGGNGNGNGHSPDGVPPSPPPITQDPAEVSKEPQTVPASPPHELELFHAEGPQ